jgi:hypothetical protein
MSGHRHDHGTEGWVRPFGRPQSERNPDPPAVCPVARAPQYRLLKLHDNVTNTMAAKQRQFNTSVSKAATGHDPEPATSTPQHQPVAVCITGLHPIHASNTSELHRSHDLNNTTKQATPLNSCINQYWQSSAADCTPNYTGYSYSCIASTFKSKHTHLFNQFHIHSSQAGR